MVNVALDLGNNFAKAGLFDQQQLVETSRFPDYDYTSIVTWVKQRQPEQLIMGSVIPIPEHFLASLQSITTARILDETLALPISIHYETPEELGQDRIAGAVAAYALFPGWNCLCIDTGSCITYDWISESGTLEGGVISPGFQMRLKAMAHFTAKLPAVELPALETSELIGQSTEACMRSGAVNGALMEIDSMINAYKKQADELKIIIGGGDAPFLVNNLKNSIFAQPDLVIKGLNQILHFNAL